MNDLTRATLAFILALFLSFEVRANSNVPALKDHTNDFFAKQVRIVEKEIGGISKKPLDNILLMAGKGKAIFYKEFKRRGLPEVDADRLSSNLATIFGCLAIYTYRSFFVEEGRQAADKAFTKDWPKVAKYLKTKAFKLFNTLYNKEMERAQ